MENCMNVFLSVNINQPAAFTVDFQGAQGTLDTQVVSPSGAKEEAIIHEVDKGKYGVRFMPRENGLHYIHVRLNSNHVPGSPFRVMVGHTTDADAGMVHAYGDGLSKGQTGQPCKFIVNTRKAGSGSLAVKVDGPKVQLNCREVEEGYEFTYNTGAPGDYLISIKDAGNTHIPGSPFKAHIEDLIKKQESADDPACNSMDTPEKMDVDNKDGVLTLPVTASSSQGGDDIGEDEEEKLLNPNGDDIVIISGESMQTSTDNSTTNTEKNVEPLESNAAHEQLARQVETNDNDINTLDNNTTEGPIESMVTGEEEDKTKENQVGSQEEKNAEEKVHETGETQNKVMEYSCESRIKNDVEHKEAETGNQILEDTSSEADKNTEAGEPKLSDATESTSSSLEAKKDAQERPVHEGSETNSAPDVQQKWLLAEPEDREMDVASTVSDALERIKSDQLWSKFLKDCGERPPKDVPKGLPKVSSNAMRAKESGELLYPSDEDTTPPRCAENACNTGKGKKPWAPAARQAVLTEMKGFITLNKVPRKAECEDCIRKTKIDRSWRDVKYLIYNENQKNKKHSK